MHARRQFEYLRGKAWQRGNESVLGLREGFFIDGSLRHRLDTLQKLGFQRLFMREAGDGRSGEVVVTQKELSRVGRRKRKREEGMGGEGEAKVSVLEMLFKKRKGDGGGRQGSPEVGPSERADGGGGSGGVGQDGTFWGVGGLGSSSSSFWGKRRTDLGTGLYDDLHLDTARLGEGTVEVRGGGVAFAVRKGERALVGVGPHDDLHLDVARLGGGKGTGEGPRITQQDTEQMGRLSVVRAGKRARV